MTKPGVTGASKGIRGWISRQGITKPLSWGYLALLLFMVGDGLELGFLALFLGDEGFTQQNIGTLITVYGVVVAGAAWLSGALAEAWGPKRVMMIGFAVWVLFHPIFLIAISTGNYPLMLLSYGIRGLGYPFFAYGFLVWVTMETPATVIGRAVGWYWFFSTAGLGVVSAYLAGLIVPVIGQFATMWLALLFIITGGLMVLFLVKGRPAQKGTAKDNLRSILKGLTVVKDHPKVGLGGTVRIINTLCFYAFPVFMPPYMVDQIGFTLTEWQTIWGTMLFANIVGNVLSGYLGDKIGHVNTVAWVGGIVSGVSVLLIYYIPETFGANFPLVMLVAIVLGLGMAAYVPLSAIVPLLAPDHKAAAVAILSLGAGLSNATGPLIARAFLGPLGVGGLIWIIAALYFVGIFITLFLRDETNPENQVAPLAAKPGGNSDETPAPGQGTPGGPDSSSQSHL